jgi:hypothetical protein
MFQFNSRSAYLLDATTDSTKGCSMTKIYLVCENVDLGYHVVKAFKEKSAAINYAKYLDDRYRKDKLVSLIKIGYTKESAESYVKNMREEFYVDETELNEVTL